MDFDGCGLRLLFRVCPVSVMCSKQGWGSGRDPLSQSSGNRRHFEFGCGRASGCSYIKLAIKLNSFLRPRTPTESFGRMSTPSCQFALEKEACLLLCFLLGRSEPSHLILVPIPAIWEVPGFLSPSIFFVCLF